MRTGRNGRRLIWLGFLLAGVLLVLSACQKGPTLTGRLLLADNGARLIILDQEGPGPVTMSFAKENQDKEGCFEGLKTGDLIEVTYNGEIMETYPGQMVIRDCRKLEDGDLSDIPAELLEHLAELGWKPAGE